MTVLGGDQRSLELAKLCAEDYDVTIYGFDGLETLKHINMARDLQEALKETTFIIGPLPFQDQSGNLNTPLCSDNIELEQVLKQLTDKQWLFGGSIDEQWMNLAKKYRVNIIDYFKQEQLQVLNAIPTAEGAIQIAMETMNITLHDANVMVLGFGRVAKTVAQMLHGIGARVYIGARNAAQLAWTTVSRYEAIPLKEIDRYLKNMDLIINTIPARVLDKEKLSVIEPDTLIIDLASHPGGVDVAFAKKRGIHVNWALALPGKVAPVSAASYIKKTIDDIIFNLEV